MEFNQVTKFGVDDIELLPDEFLKQEQIFLLVHIVETVHVGSESTTDLPSVGVLQAFQTIWVLMDVFQLTYVHQVLRLNQKGKELEVMDDVSLRRIQGKVIQSVLVLEFLLEDESSVSVVLQSVHEDLLIPFKPLVVEDQNSSQGIENQALFIVKILKGIFPVKFPC